MFILSKIKNKFFFRYFLGKKGKNVRFGKNLDIGGYNNIYINNNVVINDNVWLEALTSYNQNHYNPSIEIGNNVSIGKNSIITSINGIYIGNNCLLGPNVFITDHSHGSINELDCLLPPIKRDLYSKGKVIIKENVWIGYGSVILPNVVIGEYSIIAANSVITKNVEPYSLIGGNPGKVIRRLT